MPLTLAVQVAELSVNGSVRDTTLISVISTVLLLYVRNTGTSVYTAYVTLSIDLPCYCPSHADALP